jgi:hypothetical protein
MRSVICVVSVVALVPCLSAGPGGGKSAEAYLKDGKLKERLEVQELQGGVVGFTGTYYAINPDGTWKVGGVFREELKEPKAKGKLTAKELAELAGQLARQDLAHLPGHGESTVNPRVVRIRFGQKVSELQPLRGKSSAEEDQAIRARYQGIVQAVKALCKEPKSK